MRTYTLTHMKWYQNSSKTCYLQSKRIQLWPVDGWFFTRAVNNFLIDDEPSVNKPHELCGVVVKLIDIKRGKMDSGKISNQLSIVSTHCSCKWPNFLYWHVSWGTLNKTIGLNRSSQIDNKHSLLVRLHSLWQVDVSRRHIKYFTKYVNKWSKVNYIWNCRAKCTQISTHTCSVLYK